MRNFRNKVPVEYELVALGIKPTKKLTRRDYLNAKMAIKAFDNYFQPIEEALKKGIIEPKDMFNSDLREIA